MKKITIILILFTFSFSLALAQDSTSSSATSSASSTKLSQIEQRNEKIRNYTAQMQQRLNVIVGNLERMALRVETQINKLASSTATSTDLSAAQIKLVDAKKKIGELKTAISNLTVKAEDIIKSKTPKTAFYNVREKMVKAFIAKIKVIHKELLDSVKLAKKEIVETKAQNPSSTQDVRDCNTDLNCLIQAAAACTPTKAIITNNLSAFGIVVKTTNFHEIKVFSSGKCNYQVKTLAVDYSLAKGNDSAKAKEKLLKLENSKEDVVGIVNTCKIPNEELVRRLNNLKTGDISIEYPDPYCKIISSNIYPAMSVYVQPRRDVETKIGTKNVFVQYKTATDKTATLIITIGTDSKEINFELGKEIIFAGIGIKVMAIGQDQVEVQFVEKK